MKNLPEIRVCRSFGTASEWLWLAIEAYRQDWRDPLEPYTVFWSVKGPLVPTLQVEIEIADGLLQKTRNKDWEVLWRGAVLHFVLPEGWGRVRVRHKIGTLGLGILWPDRGRLKLRFGKK